MDLNNARRMGKQPYEAVREQFDQLGERVIERHWDERAPVRQGYRRFLGALDELAGRLLDDDEIARRGQDLLRESEAGGAGAEGAAGAGEAGVSGGAGEAGASGGAGTGATGASAAGAEGEAKVTDEAGGIGAAGATGAGGATGGTGGTGAAGATGTAGAGGAAGMAGAEAGGGAGATGAAWGADEASGASAADGEAGDSVWTQASDEADDQAAEEVRRTEEARRAEETRRADDAAVGESWAAGNARVASETSEAAEAQGAGGAGEAAQTVDVVFSLPAETEAERVALCGDFNDWATEGISLAQGDDRTWRVTVPLAPGSYRYKFLLDGETWENGPDADRLEENAYGTLDSVIEVR